MRVKEIKKTVYETIDGQQFDEKNDAKQHEINLVINNFSEKEIALMLKQICEERHTCTDCPFYAGRNVCSLMTSTPDSWVF